MPTASATRGLLAADVPHERFWKIRICRPAQSLLARMLLRLRIEHGARAHHLARVLVDDDVTAALALEDLERLVHEILRVGAGADHLEKEAADIAFTALRIE